MKKFKKFLDFISKSAGLYPKREPVYPKVPDYDERFIDALADQSITLSDMAFDAAKNDRIQIENSSYEEKKITRREIRKKQRSDLKKLEGEKSQMEEFKIAIVNDQI